ncbi:LPD7 domain-containing protein [Burkholderia stagnalis]|uniref:LPD7 domain-containing protein n=1 Tax=Burkholderia stagnalis TaxID=1503054 RepID=UPI000A8A73D1|nr:LPD7 domain-containing protein [Burkholderia stagnalis]
MENTDANKSEPTVEVVSQAASPAANETVPSASNDANSPKVYQLDDDALERVAAARAADRRRYVEEKDANLIEAVKVKELVGEQTDRADGEKRSDRTATPDAADNGKDASTSRRERGRPTMIDKMYIVADNKFYFRGRENELAFEDKGTSMSTKHNNADVARAMAEMAESKGWVSANLSGHPDFKREAWLHLSLKGIEVTGYKPKDVDLARLEELRESHKVENRIAEGRNKTQAREVVDTAVADNTSSTDAKQSDSRTLSKADQVAEVARKAAAEKGFSPAAQSVVEKVARARVEGIERAGGKVTMTKLDRNAERVRTPTPAVPTVDRGERTQER